MPVAISVGYRYLPSPNLSTKNRFGPVAEFHVPVKGRILLSDRNCLDLDWWSGRLTWRYRNRVRMAFRYLFLSSRPSRERRVLRKPYSKWSETHPFAGCLLPVGRRFQFDPYYEHESKTGPRPNEQLNAGGWILSIYFSTLEK
jgi:hypothetical protein